MKDMTIPLPVDRTMYFGISFKRITTQYYTESGRCPYMQAIT
uniref:Uncharacterized protein n=1 Tax=Rhizophora mucronata TaxID=61149 RepID=A0A2P2QYA4_RHIMU